MELANYAPVRWAYVSTLSYIPVVLKIVLSGK